METRSAERQAKPPASQGQRDELPTLRSPAAEEDEEGVYGFFCQRSSERSPEDEPDYASVDDDFSPSLGGSFPRRTWGHRPRFISLTEDCAGDRGDATSKNKFFGSGEVLAFDGLSQTKHGHVLEHGEADPLRLLWADLGRDHGNPDCEEDEDNAFFLSPGEVKTWPSRLVLLLPGGGSARCTLLSVKEGEELLLGCSVLPPPSPVLPDARQEPVISSSVSTRRRQRLLIHFGVGN